MAKEIHLDAQLWKQFEQVARAQRRNPVRLLSQVVQEYLEIYEDQKLFTQMQREARRSGHKEEEAVELVRRVRRELSTWRRNYIIGGISCTSRHNYSFGQLNPRSNYGGTY